MQDITRVAQKCFCKSLFFLNLERKEHKSNQESALIHNVVVVKSCLSCILGALGGAKKYKDVNFRLFGQTKRCRIILVYTPSSHRHSSRACTKIRFATRIVSYSVCFSSVLSSIFIPRRSISSVDSGDPDGHRHAVLLFGHGVFFLLGLLFLRSISSGRWLRLVLVVTLKLNRVEDTGTSEGIGHSHAVSREVDPRLQP